MLTSFEELLIRQMTQKAQQNRWMDPIGGWGQNKTHKRLEGRKTIGKWVTYVSRGRVAQVLSALSSLEKIARCPRVKQTYRC